VSSQPNYQPSVRVTEVQVPFGQVFVLVFKFYVAALLLGLIVGVVLAVVAAVIGVSLA